MPAQPFLDHAMTMMTTATEWVEWIRSSHKTKSLLNDVLWSRVALAANNTNRQFVPLSKCQAQAVSSCHHRRCCCCLVVVVVVVAGVFVEAIALVAAIQVAAAAVAVAVAAVDAETSNLFLPSLGENNRFVLYSDQNQ